MRINIDRLLNDIETLALFGATPEGGVRRLALTAEDKAARDWIVARMRELGLEVSIDRIGNIFGLRAGAQTGPSVMTGSHIDTVGHGGKLDGPYGVLAGLEIVRVLNECGFTSRRPLCVAVFTNEEGVRFQPDMMGSLAFAGGISLEKALAAADRDGVTVGEALAGIGYAGAAAMGAAAPCAFLELHIEQGPVLEAQGATIGVVENLQGISWREITVTGQANHAGTTPMDLRRDAGLAAAEIILRARALASEIEGQMATVGAIRFAPGSINVVSGEATLSADLRNPDESRLKRAEEELDAFLEEIGARDGFEVAWKSLARFAPVTFDARLADLIESQARALGLSVIRMTSGAGHDAQMMARICPAAMIFTPSREGVSHNPREYTSPEALEAGANVLLGAMTALAGA